MEPIARCVGGHEYGHVSPIMALAPRTMEQVSPSATFDSGCMAHPGKAIQIIVGVHLEQSHA